MVDAGNGIGAEEPRMPVSKKPRTKDASKMSPRAAAVPALPDRRAMESYLAALTGRNRNDAIAKAQDVMYDAWERTTSRSRVALARKALGISPLCADAYNLLAEEAGSVEEARTCTPKLWTRGNWLSDPKRSKNTQALSGDSLKPAPSVTGRW
jgi:ST7 protein